MPSCSSQQPMHWPWRLRARRFGHTWRKSSVVLAVLALVGLLLQRGQQAVPPKAEAEAVQPAPAPPEAKRADAEIVSFLAMLQEKGRLVDFLMDDINAFGDAQVGAAARVVHAGCKGVLQEHFSIHPVRAEPEGSTVQVPAGYSADEYRLVGKISGQAPFSGVLVHRGWKTDTVKLPQLLRVRPASSRHCSGGSGPEIERTRCSGPNHPDPDHQDATLHGPSLQSRHRPRYQQLRDGGHRSRN